MPKRTLAAGLLLLVVSLALADFAAASPARPGPHAIIALGAEHRPARCPPEEGTPGAYGDANGGAGILDFHYNIAHPTHVAPPGVDGAEDIEGTNGQLQMWCIAGTAFALVWVTANDRMIIGKCPFVGGLNGKSYLANEAGAVIASIWESKDGRDPERPRGDDDQDDEQDMWVYRYSVGADLLEQIHLENGLPQPDGVNGGAPKAPFSLDSLRPLTSTDDDPLAPGNAAVDMDTASGGPSSCSESFEVNAGSSGPAVPTLSEWGIVLLGAVLLGLGVLVARRRPDG